mmetsp:Transcript_41825/g.95040  ORF Transcript_41825/g.95040 Transcript_41825/m.95040 type:complete len:201 (+) Transcript_41825:84-686(+)
MIRLSGCSVVWFTNLFWRYCLRNASTSVQKESRRAENRCWNWRGVKPRMETFQSRTCFGGSVPTSVKYMPLTVVNRSTMVSKGQPLNCQSVPSVTTATTRSHWALLKPLTLSRTSKVHILPMTLRTISTYSGLVLSKKRMRSSSFLVYSPSCRSLPAFRMFTGAFLLQGTRMMGWCFRSDRSICSSSLSNGVLPATACKS